MAIAIVPSLLGRDWWDTWDYPSCIMDQRFASHLVEEDLLPLSRLRGFLLRPRSQCNIAASGKSEVSNDDKEFKVALNVSQFKPEELKVKVVDGYVLVHGKHEEKSDEHGFVSREFTRRYMLPRACEMDTVVSSLSSDCVLTITAPKKALEAVPKQERQIPIVAEKIQELSSGAK